MPSLEARLVAGLEAQGWIETRSHSNSWRRFGKFGRGAMYVMAQPMQRIGGNSSCWRIDPSPLGVSLWFSELHITEPDVPVFGPICEQVLLAGDKWLAQTEPDTTALLVELLDLQQPVQQRSDEEKQD